MHAALPFGRVVNQIDTWLISASTGGLRESEAPVVNTNTIVLIVVTILVALALAGVVAGFTRKFRAERRLLGGSGILDELAEDARLVAQQDDIAQQVASEAQAVQVDSDIKAFRNRGRRAESTDSRDAADMRAQLRDEGGHSD
jgi:hypothetical protein